MTKRLTAILSVILLAMMCALGVGIWFLYRDVPSAGVVSPITGIQEDSILAESGDSVAFVEPGDSAVLPSAEPVLEEKKALSDESYEIWNVKSGKMDLMGVSDGMLYMKEDDTVLWQHPFDGEICGNVVSVDFFNNGKLQYLFASGTKLHMYDRLGRSVSGFPVDLGKDILRGPVASAVYEKGKGIGPKCGVLVIHKDLSAVMYTLDGKVSPEWKGFTLSDAPSELPRLEQDSWAICLPSGEEHYSIKSGEKIQ